MATAQSAPQPDPRHIDPVWLLGNDLAKASGDMQADASFREGQNAIAEDRWWLERRSRTLPRAARLKGRCQNLSSNLQDFVEKPEIIEVRVRVLADRLLEEWLEHQRPGPWQHGEAQRFVELARETAECARLLLNVGEVRAASKSGATAATPAATVELPPQLDWLSQLPPDALGMVLHPLGSLDGFLAAFDEPNRTIRAIMNAAAACHRVLSIRRGAGDRRSLDRAADAYAQNLNEVLRRGRDELVASLPAGAVAIIDARVSRLIEAVSKLMRVSRDYPPDRLARDRRIVPGPMSAACDEYHHATMDVVAILTGQVKVTFEPAADERLLREQGHQLQDMQLTILAELAAEDRLVRASELALKKGLPPYHTLLRLLGEMEKARSPLVCRPGGKRTGYALTAAGRGEVQKRELVA